MNQPEDQAPEAQADLRRSVQEYIESLKPEWHEALALLRGETELGGPVEPGLA